MAFKFIIARIDPRASTLYSKHYVLLSVFRGKVYPMFAANLRNIRREYFTPGAFSPSGSRYDDVFPVDGRSSAQLLKDWLMIPQLNDALIDSRVSEDGESLFRSVVPRTDRFYISVWEEFTLDDVTPTYLHEICNRILPPMTSGEARSVDSLLSFVHELRSDVLSAARHLISYTCTDMESERFMPVVRARVNRRFNITSPAAVGDGLLVPHTYRALPCGGYDDATRTRAYLRNRQRYALLGEEIARGISNHPDYDESALCELLMVFNSASETLRNRLWRVIETWLPTTPDVVMCDCGHFEYQDETHDVGRESWCSPCTNENAVFCVDVEELRPRDDVYYSELQDAYYTYDYDEENGSDDDDEDEDDDDGGSVVRDYSTNVVRILETDSSIKSSQFGDFLMGVEFEMCAGSQGKNDAAETVLERLGETYCIIKYDGSLPSDGFEVVSAPRGLAEHIKRFGEWEIDPRWRAWNTNACGLHVHVDSRAFSAMTLGKFLMFINSAGNADFIRRLAGRHPLHDNQAQRYCAADGQESLDTPVKAIKGKTTERYRMVNVANLREGEARRLGLSSPQYYDGRYNTIELRIFRASLKKERLLAQIEFAHAAVMFCRSASYRDLSGTAFTKWLRTVDGNYPALAKWYGVRAARNKGAATPAEATCEDRSPEPA